MKVAHSLGPVTPGLTYTPKPFLLFGWVRIPLAWLCPGQSDPRWGQVQHRDDSAESTKQGSFTTSTWKPWDTLTVTLKRRPPAGHVCTGFSPAEGSLASEICGRGISFACPSPGHAVFPLCLGISAQGPPWAPPMLRCFRVSCHSVIPLLSPSENGVCVGPGPALCPA